MADLLAAAHVGSTLRNDKALLQELFENAPVGSLADIKNARSFPALNLPTSNDDVRQPQR